MPTRAGNAPIRPKAPAVAPMRPRVQSSADHSVPEARRAREPLPDEATVPMRRSDRPASMPAEEDWNTDNDVTTTGTSGSIPRDAASPRPANVTTDAGALRAAVLEALEPLQHALDDLTLKIARERVDRKEAIDKLERAVARVATGNPPQVTPFAAAQMLAPIQSPFSQAPVPPAQKTEAAPAPAPAQKNTLLGMSPQARAAATSATETPLPIAAQPYSVSPSANPPPVATAAAPAIPAAAPVPTDAAEKAESPAPPRVVAAVAPAAVPTAVIVTPSSPPIKIDFDYSTDLSFDLPPGLDGSRRKRMLAWAVAVIVVGGAIAMIVSMIISRSRPPGAL